MTIWAWVPAARGMPLPTLAGALTLAAAPAVITLLRGGNDLSGAVVAATIIGAAIAALVVEDPAGETLSASPTSLARRRSLRLSVIALALAVTWGVLVVASAAAATLTGDDLARRAAEAAAVSGVAAAAAGLAHRQGVASSGQIGAVAGVLGVLVISALAYRFHQFPALMTESHHGRWWLVALSGWVVTAWTWRDPAHR